MSGSGYVKQHRGFHGMYSEDNWTASQRMESTSRLETKLDNETAREEGADQGWLAAGAAPAKPRGEPTWAQDRAQALGLPTLPRTADCKCRR